MFVERCYQNLVVNSIKGWLNPQSSDCPELAYLWDRLECSLNQSFDFICVGQILVVKFRKNIRIDVVH